MQENIRLSVNWVHPLNGREINLPLIYHQKVVSNFFEIVKERAQYKYLSSYVCFISVGHNTFSRINAYLRTIMLNIVTISALVLLNILLVQCSPTVHQQADSVKKFSDDKLAPNSNSTDDASRIPEIPTFWPLGDFNGKTFMLGRTMVDFARAATDCAMMGFSLARANQAELNFLYSVTTPEDDFAWLGGHVHKSLSSFRWTYDGSEINKDIPLNFGTITPSLRLALDRYPGNSGLRVFSTDTLHYYICMF